MPTGIATQGLLLDPTILTEEEVLRLYHKAYELLLQGKTQMSLDGEATSFSYKFPVPVETMLSECRYCLRQINPSRYGHNNTMLKPYFV